MRLLLAILLVVASAWASERCAARCYSGSVAWPQGAPLSFSFLVVPCDPVVVAGASMDDGGDTLLEPVFSCAASEGTVTVVLAHEGGARLEWLYASQSTCEEVMASLDTIPGAFAGTHHTLGGQTVTDGAPLEDAQVLCAAPTCEPLCFDSGILTAAGAAAAKSPCGAVGAAACAMRVQYSLAPCTSGAVAALDVLLGTDGVRLSVYQPDALAGPALTCSDGALSLDSAAVSVAWAAPADHAADCATILLRPELFATGALRSVIVQSSSIESWQGGPSPRSIAGSLASCDALPTAMPPAPTPSPLPTHTDEEDDGETPATPDEEAGTDAPSVATDKALVPHVHCSARRNDVDCCTVFGYMNPNSHAVTLPHHRPDNFFTPKPWNRNQVQHFATNTTSIASFAVGWHCPVYLRHKLRWTLSTVAPLGKWERSIDAARERNDCSDADYATWCT